MPSEPVFRENNSEIISLMFSIKMNVVTESYTEKDLKDLELYLRKRHSLLFRTSQRLYVKREGEVQPAGGIIKAHDREVTILPDSIDYRENKNFDQKKFNDICRYLYKFVKEKKDLALEQVRLIGKVYTLHYTTDQPSVAMLKTKLGLFYGSDVNFIEVKTTIVEGDLNIHFHLRSKDDSASEGPTNIVRVRLDINNFDQFSGVKDDTIDEVIKFADNFVEKKLVEFANKNFA